MIVSRRVRFRFACAALLLTAGVAALCQLPADLVVGGPNTDLAGQFIAWRSFAAENLRAGHLPLWNPYTYAGQPFLGGFQSALLYPLNLVFLLLPLGPAINFSILAHLIILGWGMHYWASRRGLHPLAAGLVAVTLPLSGVVFPHVYAGHLPNLCTMAWAPWMFAGLEDWWRDKRTGGLLLASAAVCLQILGGQMQYVFFIGVAAGVQAIVFSFRDLKRWRRALPAVAVCFLVASGLAAAQLFPGLSAASEGVRQGKLDLSFAGSFSLPPENLLTAIAPGFFGGTVADYHAVPYWGRCYPWEMSFFVGVTGLVLAAVAWSDKECRRTVRGDFAVAAVLVLLALGRHVPVYSLLYEFVPGFGHFRGMSKFTFPAMLFLVLAIGAGADVMIRRRPVGKFLSWSVLALGVGLVGCGLFLWIRPGVLAGAFDWIRTHAENDFPAALSATTKFRFEAGMQAAGSLAMGGGLLLVAGVCLLLSGSLPRLRWVLLGTLPFEMIGFASTQVATSRLSTAMPDELKQFVTAHPGNYRVLNLLQPNNGYLLGAPDLWGDDPALLKRYAEFMAFTQGRGAEAATQHLNIDSVHPLYAMLRCQYAFVRTRTGVEVKEIPGALPWVSLVSDYRVLAGRDAIFSALDNPKFDPRQTVLLESEPEPRPQTGSDPGTVRVVGSTTDSLVVEAEVKTPALLLITDSYSRDWRARALESGGQQDYRILPANYILRAVPLAAGHHRFVVEYAPVSFRVGIMVSAVAWLLWFWVLQANLRPTHLPTAVVHAARD